MPKPSHETEQTLRDILTENVPKRLLGFRVTEAFRNQIEAESIKRDLSVQDLITEALEQYFDREPGQLHRITLTVDKGLAEEIEEQRNWDALWLKFLNTMPREKVFIHAKAMRFDLLHYKSSRRKRQQGRGAIAQGGA